MNLDYVFGPIIATDGVFNANIEFMRVVDKQDKVRGWAWDGDDEIVDTVYGDCTSGGYDIDPMVAIDDLCNALREHLTAQVEEWYERHPKAQAQLDKHRKAMDEMGIEEV